MPGRKSKARKEPDEKGKRPKRPDQRLNQERARKKAVGGREREERITKEFHSESCHSNNKLSPESHTQRQKRETEKEEREGELSDKKELGRWTALRQARHPPDYRDFPLSLSFLRVAPFSTHPFFVPQI